MSTPFDILGALGHAGSGFSEALSGRTVANAEADEAIRARQIQDEQRKQVAEQFRMREQDQYYKLHPELDENRQQQKRALEADQYGLTGTIRRDYILLGKLPTPTEPKEPKPSPEQEINERFRIGKARGLSGRDLQDFAFNGKISPKPPNMGGGGNKTIETIQARIAAINKIRAAAGKPPLAPEEESAMYGLKSDKDVFKTKEDRLIVEENENALGVVDNTKGAILDLAKTMGSAPKGGLLSSVFGGTDNSIQAMLKGKGAKWLYAHGIKPDDLYEQYINNIAILRVIGMRPFMKGRPNQKLQELILEHLPNTTDTPDLAMNKLKLIKRYVEAQRRNILIDNGIKPEEWDQKRQQLGGGGIEVDPSVYQAPPDETRTIPIGAIFPDNG